jgi:hypothetical protein
MEEYIKKSALVEEIEKLKGKVSDGSSYYNGWQHALRMLEIEINTLEVEKVDLENEQRLKDCPFRQVGCAMYNGHIFECKDTCSWVVDYQKLKELNKE